EVAADSMAGAVIEVEPCRPQMRARETVELGSGDAVREDRPRDGDMAFEDAGETVGHLGAGFADDHAPSDNGGAVLILGAGVEQKQLARNDLAVGLAGHAIVHDSAIRARARNGRERNVPEKPRLAAEGLERLDSVDFGELTSGRHAVEPGEEV